MKLHQTLSVTHTFTLLCIPTYLSELPQTE